MEPWVLVARGFWERVTNVIPYHIIVGSVALAAQWFLQLGIQRSLSQIIPALVNILCTIASTSDHEHTKDLWQYSSAETDLRECLPTKTLRL